MKTKKEELIEKLNTVRNYGYYIKLDPSMTGMSGYSGNGSKSITVGRTDIDGMIKICDNIIKEEKERKNYDPSELNNILIEVFK